MGMMRWGGLSSSRASSKLRHKLKPLKIFLRTEIILATETASVCGRVYLKALQPHKVRAFSFVSASTIHDDRALTVCQVCPVRKRNKISQIVSDGKGGEKLMEADKY